MTVVARKLILALSFAVLAAGARAQGATGTVSVTFSAQPSSPASTSVTCPASGPWTLPVPAGTVLSTCTVLPTMWIGSMAVSGATGITTSGTQVVVGASAYNTPGAVNLTVTTTP
jgi:hypothetical protein